MKMIIVLSFCFITMSTTSLIAQVQADKQQMRHAFGAYGNFNLNEHRADFRALPGVPSCCPNYSEGNGTGFTAGLYYELPLSNAFSLLLRGSYSSHNATLKATEKTFAGINGNTVQSAIEHSIDSRISSIGLEPLLGYRLFDNVFIHLGGRMGYILQKKYNESELLIDPAGEGTFENGLRSRNILSGNIPNASLINSSIIGGVSYQLPLNTIGTLFLVPEILYSYSVIPVVKNYAWNADAIRLGVAIKYSPLPFVESPLPPPPPTIFKQPTLTASISASGVDKDGKEYPVAQIRIEEFISTQMRPLLNYIFFDENSSSIPARYFKLTHDQISAFEIDQLHAINTLDVYHHILDIIGKRMQNYPNSKITIVGCNANIGMETNNLKLSTERAEAVKNYLKEVWNIPTRRMLIESHNLPYKSSTMIEIDGINENRRVEIYSDTWGILEPITTKNIHQEITPPIIRFRPIAEVESGIARWELRINHENKPINNFSDNGILPEVINWNIDQSKHSIPLNNTFIQYTLEVSDNAKQNYTTGERTLPVEVVSVQIKRSGKIRDKQFDRYNLILFDFDKSDINANNKKIVEIMKQRIPKNATISIGGYTDRIGDDSHNLLLSEERAEMISKILQLSSYDVKGFGESKLLFDNELPEGRFYSRTVEVIVEIPIN